MNADRSTYPKAEKMIREARTRLVFARPYYAKAAFASRFIITPEVPSLSIDEWWRIYVNPRWIEQYGIAVGATALAHELNHNLRDHASRARAAGVTMQTAEVWSLESADPEINPGLCRDCAEQRPQLPLLPSEWCVLPKHFDLPEKKVAEWYYAERMKRRRECKAAGGSVAKKSAEGIGMFGCGSGATGIPAPWEVGSPAASGVDGLDDADAWDVRRQTARAVLDHAKGHGSVPSDLMDWANDLIRPKVIPWDRLLVGAMRRSTLTVAGAVTHSYTRPSRRQDAFGSVIMPAYRRPVPNVVLVSDTSLSMDKVRLALVRGVVESACRHVGAALRAIDVDAAVHVDKMITTGRLAAHVGRGGTDMRVGIERAMLRPRPAHCIVLSTDCETPWPLVRPRAKVIVAAIGARAGALALVPAWATVINVEIAA